MTQRSPIYGRVGPREHPRDLLTWTNGVQQGLQPTPFIQRQWDWPNPVRAIVNSDLRTWIDCLPQSALNLTIPAGQRQRDWPNPLPYKQNQALLGFNVAPQIAVQVVVSLPFNQADWSSPVARARATLSWSFGIQQGLQPTPFIARQSDWPNPAPARRNLEPLSWSFKLQIPPAVASPFNQNDWSNPPQKPPNLSLRSWVQSLSVPAVGRPVRQLDWPNPGQSRRALALLVDYTPNTTARGIPAAPGTILLETIPYLIGAEEYSARIMLGSIYMVVVVIGTGGTVTAQSVAPFTQVVRGTTVTITMGGPVYTPSRGGGNIPYNLH